MTIFLGMNVIISLDGKVKMIDLVNEQNSSEIQTIHEEARIMRVCPNGRYVITAGAQGDIAIWNIKK